MKNFIKINLIALILLSSNAFSEMYFCNTTGKLISIAFGHHKNSKIKTDGWFNVKDKTCSAVLKGDLSKLDSNILYFYAHTTDKKLVWTGKKQLCTKVPGPFSYANAEKCNTGKFEKFVAFSVEDNKSSTIALTNNGDKTFFSIVDVEEIDSFEIDFSEPEGAVLVK